MTVRTPAFVRRWLKFNAVGGMGICVQMLAVYLLGAVLNCSPLWSTALGVEAAVLHNFLWHERFTWADRRSSGRVLRRLLAFHVTAGAVSLGGNLLFVSWFLHQLHVPLLAANLLAVAACSVINFVVNDKIVFRATGKSLEFSRN